MKRFLIILIFALIPVFIFSTDGPIRLGAGLGIPNAVGVLRIDRLDIKLGYNLAENQEFLFLSGDYRLVREQYIASIFYFSLGIGGFTRIYSGDDSDNEIEAGGRIPITIHVFAMDNFLEFFFELSPAFGLYPTFQFSDDPIQIWVGMTLKLK